MKTIIDDYSGEIFYKYELTNGEIQRSFGIKIAEIMKMPKKITSEAYEKEKE